MGVLRAVGSIYWFAMYTGGARSRRPLDSYNRGVAEVEMVIQDTWFNFVRSFDEIEDTSNAHSRGWTILYQTAAALAAAVVILFVIFTFCLRGVAVSGSSMESTLHDGDMLAVASLPAAHNGDIVIITQPNTMDKPIVKRVIASGGQEVDIDFVAGIVTVDGKVLSEPYIKEPTSAAGDVQFPLVVPEGCFFVVGDNRNNSLDSRYSVIDCIDENYILGVVRFRAYPFSAIQIIR